MDLLCLRRFLAGARCPLLCQQPCSICWASIRATAPRSPDLPPKLPQPGLAASAGAPLSQRCPAGSAQCPEGRSVQRQGSLVLLPCAQSEHPCLSQSICPARGPQTLLACTAHQRLTAPGKRVWCAGHTLLKRTIHTQTRSFLWVGTHPIIPASGLRGSPGAHALLGSGSPGAHALLGSEDHLAPTLCWAQRITWRPRFVRSCRPPSPPNTPLLTPGPPEHAWYLPWRRHLSWQCSCLTASCTPQSAAIPGYPRPGAPLLLLPQPRQHRNTISHPTRPPRRPCA